MDIKVITGLSGSGKSTTLKAFEDLGYYCIDNMPPKILVEFAKAYAGLNEKNHLAAVMDLRLGVFFHDLEDSIKQLKEAGHQVQVLFIEATDKRLLHRFNAIRRAHPLEENGATLEAIQKEREILSRLRKQADLVFDTTDLNIHELTSMIINQQEGDQRRPFQVVLVSFGFKRGILEDADYVFDLRILRNPYYEEKLKALTGMDERIRDYIFESDLSKEYFEKLTHLLDFLIQAHKKDNRYNITIGLGCTGGKHRSVTFGYLLNQRYQKMGYETILRNRDITR